THPSPLENYLSRYNITRSNQPASGADVLSIREFLPRLSSAGAGLTGATRLNQLQRAPGAFGLVRKFREEGRPRDIVYRLGEHTASQALDMQIFNGNHCKIPHQPEREFVLKLVP